MREVDEKNETKEDENRSSDEGNIIAPEHEKAVGDKEADGDKDNPQENLRAPPSVLDGSPLIPGISNADEGSTEDGVEQGEGKANTMHRQYAITLVVRTIHLDVVVAPLLNEFDHHRRLHKPRKHRVNQEYHRESNAGCDG